MGENKKGIEYYLEKMTEMSDVIESSDIFVSSKIEVNILTEDDEYNHLIRHFRKVDWNNDRFTIEIGETKYNIIRKN